jgi:dihydrofolate reductase
MNPRKPHPSPQRKLSVFESISVDGYFADANNGMDWAHFGRDDPEFAGWVGERANSGDELLFGRNTYEMMAAFWPTSAATAHMPDVAKGMNAARKYVASRTVQPTWNNTHRLQGELVASVRKLKETAGPDITILGSGSVSAQLGLAGLVDEYLFVIIPIVLGEGRTVFKSSRPLRLVSHRIFHCGNVALGYAA